LIVDLVVKLPYNLLGYQLLINCFKVDSADLVVHNYQLK